MSSAPMTILMSDDWPIIRIHLFHTVHSTFAEPSWLPEHCLSRCSQADALPPRGVGSCAPMTINMPTTILSHLQAICDTDQNPHVILLKKGRIVSVLGVKRSPCCCPEGKRAIHVKVMYLHCQKHCCQSAKCCELCQHGRHHPNSQAHLASHTRRHGRLSKANAAALCRCGCLDKARSKGTAPAATIAS